MPADAGMMGGARNDGRDLPSAIAGTGPQIIGFQLVFKSARWSMPKRSASQSAIIS